MSRIRDLLNTPTPDPAEIPTSSINTRSGRQRLAAASTDEAAHALATFSTSSVPAPYPWQDSGPINRLSDARPSHSNVNAERGRGSTGAVTEPDSPQMSQGVAEYVRLSQVPPEPKRDQAGFRKIEFFDCGLVDDDEDQPYNAPPIVEAARLTVQATSAPSDDPYVPKTSTTVTKKIPPGSRKSMPAPKKVALEAKKGNSTARKSLPTTKSDAPQSKQGKAKTSKSASLKSVMLSPPLKKVAPSPPEVSAETLPVLVSDSQDILSDSDLPAEITNEFGDVPALSVDAPIESIDNQDTVDVIPAISSGHADQSVCASAISDHSEPINSHAESIHNDTISGTAESSHDEMISASVESSHDDLVSVQAVSLHNSPAALIHEELNDTQAESGHEAIRNNSPACTSIDGPINAVTGACDIPVETGEGCAADPLAPVGSEKLDLVAKIEHIDVNDHTVDDIRSLESSEYRTIAPQSDVNSLVETPLDAEAVQVKQMLAELPKKRPALKSSTKKKMGRPPKKRKLDASGSEASPAPSVNTKTAAKRKSVATTTSRPSSPFIRVNPLASSEDDSTMVDEEEGEDDGYDLDDPANSDDDSAYCICRRPDNGTPMIACDGPCGEWYHMKCMNVAERNQNLIDRYICPRCFEETGEPTTWKPMCRRPECRLPARVKPDLEDTKKSRKSKTEKFKPSKYCSERCGLETFERLLRLTRQSQIEQKVQARKKSITQAVRPADVGPLGGPLSSAELKTLLSSVTGVDEFRRLGEGILSPPLTPRRNDADAIMMSEVQRERLHTIGAEKERRRARYLLLKDRLKFVTLAKQAAVHMAEQRGVKPKELCGFDPRVSQNDICFRAWLDCSEGREAMQTGKIPLPTGENDSIGSPDIMCMKKRCARHTDWAKIAVDGLRSVMADNNDSIRALDREAKEIKENATIRARATTTAEAEGQVEVHEMVPIAGRACSREYLMDNDDLKHEDGGTAPGLIGGHTDVTGMDTPAMSPLAERVDIDGLDQDQDISMADA